MLVASKVNENRRCRTKNMLHVTVLYTNVNIGRASVRNLKLYPHLQIFQEPSDNISKSVWLFDWQFVPLVCPGASSSHTTDNFLGQHMLPKYH